MATEDDQQQQADLEDDGQLPAPEAGSTPENDRFSWMNDTLEWGIRDRPGKRGLTMRDLNVGSYG